MHFGVDFAVLASLRTLVVVIGNRQAPRGRGQLENPTNHPTILFGSCFGLRESSIQVVSVKIGKIFPISTKHKATWAVEAVCLTNITYLFSTSRIRMGKLTSIHLVWRR